jgi:transposase
MIFGKKYGETGSTSNRLRSGRPPKLNEDQKKAIVATAEKNRRKPLRDIGNEHDPPVCRTVV